ncbi:hypothetical protein ACTPOK_18980 [Streptomyces inhibens]|uniref:hypothetical protein n=1 Tax=Streptomyces inhibens TaxID=2293571 RepID=UPI00402B005C
MIAAFMRLLALLFPGYGKHRAAATPQPSAAPAPRPPCTPLPRHKSRYAHDAAEHRPFVDPLNSVRPYVLSRSRTRPDNPRYRATAAPRWVRSGVA